MHSRRDVLAGLGAVAVGGLSATTATAQTDGSYPHADAKPAGATIEFDEAWLESYQPLLRTDLLEVTPTSLYGFRARSEGEATDVAVFFAHYPTQRGVTNRDSHYLDREPFYVFVDSETGEIDSVAYSAYHWLANVEQRPPTYSSETGEHPTALVVTNWHHYVLDSSYWVFDDSRRDFLEIRDLQSVHSPHLEDGSTAWLDNGWADTLRVGAVLDPWIMQDAPDWWQDDIGRFSVEALARRAYLAASRTPGINIAGAGQTDLQ
ncbi:hypothetical protein [Natrinema ejinorense]|uniref:Uncharacterized protein n=1 Tax=Natrinema ejinorense TaxID=373386 RepID=A0A2A5QPB2_9EURY|nr:hypothetical protein [Natrinema ejinorense]PCR88686.1 hypothetical protein CP557_21905 [Natrinema ejinorense]